jgi:hypothetical protein
MRYLSMSVDLIPSHALYDQYSACNVASQLVVLVDDFSGPTATPRQ